MYDYWSIIGRPMGYRSDNNSQMGPIHGARQIELWTG